jgi:2,3-bisphosphoglycerate-independent phosphoglycerate mutase
MSTQAVKFTYASGHSEEFTPPSVTDLAYQGVDAGDAILCLNLRPNRVQQLLEGLSQPVFTHTTREALPASVKVASLVDLPTLSGVDAFFSVPTVSNTLGQWVSEQGWTQSRFAETQKATSVTTAFNGGRLQPYSGETRCLIPSPRQVDTYKDAPRMNLDALIEAVTKRLQTHRDALTVVNVANTDVVAHTGDVPATIQAVEAVDAALAPLLSMCERKGITMVITSSHAHADKLQSLDGGTLTGHSCSPVPLVMVPPTAYDEATWQHLQARLEACTTLMDVPVLVQELLSLPQRVQRVGCV